jgi:hypothetical protein
LSKKISGVVWSSMRSVVVYWLLVMSVVMDRIVIGCVLPAKLCVVDWGVNG